jgi:hypothetical protein
MSSELHSFHAELIARDEEALWNWPRRSAAIMAEELALMCEQLAGLLRRQGEAAEGEAEHDPIESAKLNYMYGSTLLTLAEREKPGLLPHAVERLGDALFLARRHVPERVVTIKSQLYRAEHSLAMLRSSTGSDERPREKEVA